MVIGHRSALIFGVIVILLSVARVDAENVIVSRSVNLRPTASTTHPAIRQLDPGTSLELISSQARNGFLHVRVDDGREGWVFARNVRREGHAVHATAAPHGGGQGACATSLSQCPEDGCEAAGSSHALVNRQKRKLPDTTSAPKQLTFDDFKALQTDVTRDLKIPEDSEIDDRSALSDLEVKDGSQVSEGEYVSLAGFISPHRELRPGSAESVNCRLTGEPNTDIHVPIVQKSNEDEFKSIVAEPIPQHRAPGVSVSSLKSLQANHTLVLVRGQLFYDNLHRVNKDPQHPLGTQPKRVSLWEIHPVTEILTCKHADGNCDPEVPGDWQALH